MVEVLVNAMVHRAAKIQRNRFLPAIREVSSQQEASSKRSGMSIGRSESAPDISGSASPPGSTRPRNETQYSTTSSLSAASAAVVPVPVVNSSAIMDRHRTDSSDSNSTLPGELLLFSNTASSSYISGSLAVHSASSILMCHLQQQASP